jgi:transcription antitermination factor NusB
MRNRDDQAPYRKAALLVLASLDISPQETSEALRLERGTLREEFGPDLDANWHLVEERVEGVFSQMAKLNDEIQAVSPRWKMSRMAPVDRSILRLGFWDILHGGYNAWAVINDCVELAKDYGEKGTPAFVNGLLDQMCKNHGISIL